MKIAGSALSLIGNTPLVKLSKATKDVKANVLVKCEYFNPSGSLKDRMALRMVEEAEKAGLLKLGGTIIEQTSGNAGPALSFVGNVKGYRVRLLIPSKWGSDLYNPENRIKIMRFFGAEVEHVTTAGYGKIIKELKPEEQTAAHMLNMMKKCHELEKSDPKVWWSNQMCNPFNTLAHRDTTGREILEQTDGKVDAWVASVGSGGTLFGVAQALRKVNPDLKVVGLEPEDSPITDWVKRGSLQSLFERFGLPRMKFIVETMIEAGVPDQIIRPKDEDAREMANRLCREEGLMCGMSSGDNVWAAVQLAKRMEKGENVVTVLVDRRDRYYPEHPREHYVI